MVFISYKVVKIGAPPPRDPPTTGAVSYSHICTLACKHRDAHACRVFRHALNWVLLVLTAELPAR